MATKQRKAGSRASAPTSPKRADYKPEGVERKTGLFATLKRTGKEFSEDNMTDWAASLTYFGLLAMFPALIVLVSLVGPLRRPEVDHRHDHRDRDRAGALLRRRDLLGPDRAGDLEPQQCGSGARARARDGTLVGFGYVGTFMRASNVVYETPEGRPFWKLRPLQILVTLAMIILLALLAIGIVMTGPLVEAVAGPIGISDSAVTVWNIAKWPVIAAVFVLMIWILYYASPNVKQRGFRWVTPGSAIALVVWILASAAFAFYVCELRLLQQDLWLARNRRRRPDLVLDHESRDPVRPRVERRARAQCRDG